MKRIAWFVLGLVVGLLAADVLASNGTVRNLWFSYAGGMIPASNTSFMLLPVCPADLNEVPSLAMCGDPAMGRIRFKDADGSWRF